MASGRQPPGGQQGKPAAKPPPAEPPNRIAVVRSLFGRTMPSHLAKVMPKGANVERWAKVFLMHVEQSAGSRSDLTVCSDGSLCRALMHSAEVGLQVGGPYPHAWVIPYWNDDRKVHEAQFQISVWGYVELFRRSGLVKKIWADCVYENDPFECISGTEGKIIKHSPQWFEPRAQRGAMLGSYACALLENDEVVCEPVSAEDLELARKQNRGKSPAWDLWPDQQAQKVAIKRLGKYLPKGELTDRALEIDEDPAGAGTVIDVEAVEVPAERPAAAAPLDDVVARERARETDGKLVVNRAELFARLVDLDERWGKRREVVDNWPEPEALSAMAYVIAISKDLPADAVPPEKPAHLRLDREPGEEG